MRQHERRRKPGLILILLGLLVVTAALGLTGYNLVIQKQAALAAENHLAQLKTQLQELNSTASAPESVQEYYELVPKEESLTTSVEQEPEFTVPDYILDPNRDMPVKTIDGADYIGVLYIPALTLELPVLSEWSDEGSRIALCRYNGSAYLNNMVIAGHNYSGYFGQLKSLNYGEIVYFTDMDGNQFTYEVISIETIQPTEVEQMITGDWDLTLFTCTVGGQTRIAIRCVLTA